MDLKFISTLINCGFNFFNSLFSLVGFLVLIYIFDFL